MDPRLQPWGALILDDDQSQRTCLVQPDGWDGNDASTVASVQPVPVCKPGKADAPPIEAGAPHIADAGTD